MSDIKDLGQDAAIEKLKVLAGGIDICLFGSGFGDMDGSRFRPMSTKRVDASGNIYFLSEKDGGKNREIAADPRVT